MKAFAAILTLSLAGPAAADARIDYETTGSSCSHGIGKVQMKGKRLRWDMLDGSASAVFDGFENTLTGLDHERRQLSQMDVDFDTLDYKVDVMASADRKLSPSMRALQGQADDADCRQLLKEMPRYEAGRGAAPVQIGNCQIAADGKSARATAATPGAGMAGMTAMPGMTPEQMKEMQQAMQSMNANGAQLGMTPEQMQQMMNAMGQQAGQAPGSNGKLNATEADFEHPAIAMVPAGGVMGTMGGLVGKPASQVRVQAAGAMQTINGIACTPYERYLGDDLLARECWAKNTDLPLPQKEIATMTAANIAVGMLQNMGDQNRAPARRAAARETLVQRQCSGELGTVEIKVSDAPVSEDVFEIPSGYRNAMGEGR